MTATSLASTNSNIAPSLLYIFKYTKKFLNKQEFQWIFFGVRLIAVHELQSVIPTAKVQHFLQMAKLFMLKNVKA